MKSPSTMCAGCATRRRVPARAAQPVASRCIDHVKFCRRAPITEMPEAAFLASLLLAHPDVPSMRVLRDPYFFGFDITSLRDMSLHRNAGRFAQRQTQVPESQADKSRKNDPAARQRGFDP